MYYNAIDCNLSLSLCRGPELPPAHPAVALQLAGQREEDAVQLQRASGAAARCVPLQSVTDSWHTFETLPGGIWPAFGIMRSFLGLRRHRHWIRLVALWRMDRFSAWDVSSEAPNNVFPHANYL